MKKQKDWCCICGGQHDRRWWKVIEATKELKEDLKRRKEELAVSEEFWTLSAWGRCARTLPLKRRRNGSGSQVDHRCTIECLEEHVESVQRWWGWKMISCHNGRGNLLVTLGTRCLKMWKLATFSQSISCGRARTSSGMWWKKRKDEEPSLSHTFVSIEGCSCGRLHVVGPPPTMERAVNRKSMGGWWCGACGQPYDWRKPNRLLSLQFGDTAKEWWFSLLAEHHLVNVTK